MKQLGQARPRLLCSLVHKFGRKGVDNFEQFIAELQAQPSQTVGEIFVFVDECHRTQSGTLHRVMKAIMPNASIRLNTDLARKPRECLEYIVVHEMAHLLEPTHNTPFTTLMDSLIPEWRRRREMLNRLPVRHETWEY